MKYFLKIVWSLFACPVLVAAASETAVDGRQFALEFDGGRVITRGELQELPTNDASVERFILDTPALAVTLSSRSAAVAYRRTFVEVTNTGKEDLPVKRIVMLDVPVITGAHVAGECVGSPVTTASSFFGVEHPFAENTVAAGRIRCALPLMLPLRPGEKAVASFVYGQVSEPSQLRRAFAAYLEKERPRPSAPFLLHNTWYNLGYSNPFSEQDELLLIDTLGHELVERRGARIQGFVLDDGWDDTHTLWRFHSGWPEGMKNMKVAAARWGAVPGVWMSPWGGYNRPKQERLAAAKPEGFEIRDGGFSLAGPRYYQRFRELCVRAVQEGGVGFFKFDGIGTRREGVIDPAAGRDFDAMLRLITELRALKSDLYVSQTVGTWPSPWWLLHVDNIWRGGNDHDFAGEGSDRQRWITYRDSQVYNNVVRRAPLFPLNSLMLHGIILAKHAEHLATTERSDFADEVHSFFGSGVQLQELYLSPELLTSENWDDLATTARWAASNADVLKDSHWIGGDPVKLEPYGWAAWSSRLGIVTLRNPSARPAHFIFEPGSAFELPTGASKDFYVVEAFANADVPRTLLESGHSVEVSLKPFEVRVIEAHPLTE